VSDQNIAPAAGARDGAPARGVHSGQGRRRFGEEAPMKTREMFALIALASLVACAPPDRDVWDFLPGEAPPPGSPRWDTSMWSRYWLDALAYDSATSTITFEFQTAGWGYEPELYILENHFTRDWDELHTLEEVYRTPSAPRRSFFRRELEVVPSYIQQYQDVSTIMGPERYNPWVGDFSALVGLLLRDARGRPSDCIVFGYDPAGLAVPPMVSPPAWLDARYCRNVNP
jgi:hypothetical protein